MLGLLTTLWIFAFVKMIVCFGGIWFFVLAYISRKMIREMEKLED